MKTRNIIMFAVIISILIYFSFSRVYSNDYYFMPMMGDYQHNSLGYIDLGLIWIGISIFVILLISNLPKPRSNKADSILDYRLSKGIISIEDYKSIKAELKGRD